MLIPVGGKPDPEIVLREKGNPLFTWFLLSLAPEEPNNQGIGFRGRDGPILIRTSQSDWF
jgi:hypothetical protein